MGTTLSNSDFRGDFNTTLPDPSRPTIHKFSCNCLFQMRLSMLNYKCFYNNKPRLSRPEKTLISYHLSTY